MNIDEYRAMKAQEVAKKDSSEGGEQPNTEPEKQEVQKQPTNTQSTSTQAEPTQTNTTDTDTKSTNQSDEPKLPEKILIDGVGEIDFEELKKGYLRTSDYTKKTQEVARQRKELEEAIKFWEGIKQNPQLLEQLANLNQLPQNLDPVQSRIIELENKLYDLILEKEVERLKDKYPDFEAREVLQTAYDKQIDNLEDAYFLTVSKKQPKKKTDDTQLDIEELKKQLKEELRKEVLNEINPDATNSIITPNSSNAPIQDNSPKLSDAEKKVARMMKLSEEEYVKWRDINAKK